MTDPPVVDENIPRHLFQAFGVELEYMIVDSQSLDVRPLADRLLHEVAGAYLAEIEMGQIAWSNELALHVIELKTNGPAASLGDLTELFQAQVEHINRILEPLGSRLMPTAMHPWMDPDRELKLWPHEYNPVYEAYDRIFDCRGHGWANLQSVHLNLPFADDDEFGRLHAAIRLVLPILPALAASSPIADRKLAETADYRMEVCRLNSLRVPSVSADMIPEPVYTKADYERIILQLMYDEIAPLDPDGVLRHEWLNARGAIARFDRNTIEIRVLDVQECPAADIAICELISSVLQAMTEERWTRSAEQQAIAVEPLAQLFVACVHDAEQTVITDRAYLQQFGFSGNRATAQQLWQHLVGEIDLSSTSNDSLATILNQGPLSRRIQRALAGDMTRLNRVYGELCDCLADGRMFA